MRGVIHDDDMDSDAAQKVQAHCVTKMRFNEETPAKKAN